MNSTISPAFSISFSTAWTLSNSRDISLAIGTHIQRPKLLVAQAFRHVAIDDAQRPFGDGGLADTGFTDQHRVVLGPARQHLHGAADFLVAADDRVDLPRFGGFGQVARVFRQRLIAVLGARTVSGAALANIVDGAVQRLRVHLAGSQRILGIGVGHGKRGQNPLCRNETVPRFLSELLRLIQHADQRRVDIDLPLAARDFGQLGNGRIDSLAHGLGITTGFRDQICCKSLIVIDQGLQQVLRHDTLVFLADRNGLRGLHEPARTLGKFFHIHGHLSFAAPACGAAHLWHGPAGLRPVTW